MYPGRKPRRQVFSRRGSYRDIFDFFTEIKDLESGGLHFLKCIMVWASGFLKIMETSLADALDIRLYQATQKR